MRSFIIPHYSFLFGDEKEDRIFEEGDSP